MRKFYPESLRQCKCDMTLGIFGKKGVLGKRSIQGSRLKLLPVLSAVGLGCLRWFKNGVIREAVAAFRFFLRNGFAEAFWVIRRTIK